MTSDAYVILYVWHDNDYVPGVTVHGHAATEEEANAAVEKLMEPSRQWRNEQAMYENACRLLKLIDEDTSKYPPPQRPRPYYEEGSPWDGFFVMKSEEI